MAELRQLDRRRAILDLLESANDNVVESVRRGLYQANFERRGGDADFHNALAEHKAISARALSLFEPGEESVAFWTQIELYSAFVEPALLLLTGRPLSRETGEPIYTCVRVDLLQSWVQGGEGPKYAEELSSELDTFRHALVPPQTETPPDMVWAPICHPW